MGGILRSTSRLENENSFLGNYFSKNLSLVEVWMGFESAMEAQRIEVHIDIEKHGREIYTHENFDIVQKEFWNACVYCGVEGTKEKDGKSIFSILDNIMVSGDKVRKHKEVVVHLSNQVAQCSCKMFESEGMPCRPILFVLKGKGLSEIPSVIP
ncbi:hypothetical protein GYH30_024795 [Glycine max]|uniref:SWIM-type domain-containing protein n=1 Tax=Glycine max TaxID=3847 RepID=A0A0R0IDE9_SOYBN|nr:hypothetical protein GYH30_024795 [Glycine max]